MFDFLAESPQDRVRLCGPGVSRREFLQVGSLAAVGLSLPQYLQAKEEGIVKPADDRRSCIMIFNLGGPSHIDLWDMKPDAPSEIRGPFKPIRTQSNAFEISELLPRHAAIADKFSLVRSCHHDGAAVHDAGWQMMQTGRRFTGGIQTPHAGAVLSHLKGRRTDLPPFVVLPQLMGRGGGNLPNGQAGGFLGKAHDPFALMADPSQKNFKVPDLLPPDQIGAHRLERRRKMREIVESSVAQFEASEDARLSDLIAANDTSTSDRALYISQQEDIRRQADDLGLIEPETGVIQGSLEGLALELPDLYAAPGSVFLDARGSDGAIWINNQRLSSTPATLPSQIKVYNDASISVSNTAPVMVFANDMVIDDSRVVDVVNGTYTVFSPGSLYINRQAGSENFESTATPAGSITISQNARKDAPLPEGYPSNTPPPDLYLTGSVINEAGAVKVSNSTDSVIVSGELRGSSVEITAAGNFQLSNETVVQSGARPLPRGGRRRDTRVAGIPGRPDVPWRRSRGGRGNLDGGR